MRTVSKDRLREFCRNLIVDSRVQPDQPVEGTTWCNLAVHLAAKGLYGYDNFQGKLANQIVDIMFSSKEWVRVYPQAADTFAQKGFLCVAGRKGIKHGHVAVVYPSDNGSLEFSGKWKEQVPYLANVGPKDLMGIRGANYCFKDRPYYYLYLKEAEDV